MEKLARRLANKIASSLSCDDEREAVIAYGLIAILQITVTILIVMLLGIAFGVLAESLIVCFSVSFLRKYSGGAHAQTAEFCTAITAVYCTLTAAISKYLLLSVYHPIAILAAVIAVYSCSFWIVYRYVPVDSPNKPIRTETKIKRMRRGSYIIIAVYMMLSIAFFTFSDRMDMFISYGISLLFGVSWQAFTLTPVGAVTLDRLNSMFSFNERR